MGTTVSVLLARGGSKGIPGKNLRPVGGLSLVARSVIACRNAASVDAVYVSTDAKDIAEEARRYGARIIDRPAELSGDLASSEAGWLHALDVIRAGDFPDVERLVLPQCTSPFTTGTDIDGALAEMERTGAACALTVVPNHYFLWRRNDTGYGVGVNHDEKLQRQRRQDLEPTFKESGAFYCVRAVDFERVGRRFCGDVALYEVDHPPLEIDEEEDLVVCDLYARRQAADGAPDLAKVKALVMDFDGVHTDDLVHVDQNGVEQVSVSRRDGLGVERLRKDGRWKLLILSKEKNPVVTRRAEKLQVECLQARDDKVAALNEWLAAAGLDWDEILFVGNDLNDLPALQRAGVAACPLDADPAVLGICSWVIPVPGGRGVLRAISDALLTGKGPHD